MRNMIEEAIFWLYSLTYRRFFLLHSFVGWFGITLQREIPVIWGTCSNSNGRQALQDDARICIEKSMMFHWDLTFNAILGIFTAKRLDKDRECWRPLARVITELFRKIDTPLVSPTPPCVLCFFPRYTLALRKRWLSCVKAPAKLAC